MKRTPFVHIFLLTAFLANTFGPIPLAQAQEFKLPAPGVMVHLSTEFNPPVLRGIKVHPNNPFQFEFILDQGDSSVIPTQEGIQKLIKYFLASLTIPEKDLWVNLSPYEKDRIIPQSFGLTEMGRDLLAEDYMLKQITASLIYPEDEVGKRFWKRIYAEAAKKFGTTNISVNTFNKVWIVPEKAVVYENAKAGTAYVVEAKLKVMLEQDYLSLSRHSEGGRSTTEESKSSSVNNLGSQIVREIVIPELTKEVNQGKNFAQLRQVYNSLILAAWYKKKIKESILAQVYEDKNKVKGLSYLSENNMSSLDRKDMSSPNAFIGDPEHIYQKYLKAFKKGAFNYIKEEIDPITQQTLPKKYFSGGVDATRFSNLAMVTTTDTAQLPQGTSKEFVLNIDLKPDHAMLSDKIVFKVLDLDDKQIDETDAKENIILNSEMGLKELMQLSLDSFFINMVDPIPGTSRDIFAFLVEDLLMNSIDRQPNKEKVSVMMKTFSNAFGHSIFKMTIHQKFVTEPQWLKLLGNAQLGKNFQHELRKERKLFEHKGSALKTFMTDFAKNIPSRLEFEKDDKGGMTTTLWVKVNSGDQAMVMPRYEDLKNRMRYDKTSKIHRMFIKDDQGNEQELRRIGGNTADIYSYGQMVIRVYNTYKVYFKSIPRFNYLAKKGVSPGVMDFGFVNNDEKQGYFTLVERIVGKKVDRIEALTPDQEKMALELMESIINLRITIDDPKDDNFILGYKATDRKKEVRIWLQDAEFATRSQQTVYELAQYYYGLAVSSKKYAYRKILGNHLVLDYLKELIEGGHGNGDEAMVVKMAKDWKQGDIIKDRNSGNELAVSGTPMRREPDGSIIRLVVTHIPRVGVRFYSLKEADAKFVFISVPGGKVMDILENLRESLKLSQEAFARRAGVTYKTYRSWRIGESKPYFSSIVAIAENFGLDQGKKEALFEQWLRENPINSPNETSATIIESRIKLGLTREELVKRMGLHDYDIAKISSYEVKGVKPSEKMFKKLSEALGWKDIGDENLGGILKRARISKGLAKTQVSGINRKFLADIENGTSIPSEQMTRALAEQYGLSNIEGLLEKREEELASRKNLKENLEGEPDDAAMASSTRRRFIRDAFIWGAAIAAAGVQSGNIPLPEEKGFGKKQQRVIELTYNEYKMLQARFKTKPWISLEGAKQKSFFRNDRVFVSKPDEWDYFQLAGYSLMIFRSWVGMARSESTRRSVSWGLVFGVTSVLAALAGISLNDKIFSSSHEEGYTLPKNKVVLPLKEHLNDSIDAPFIHAVGHELSHFLELPNNKLLANAYAILVGTNVSRQTTQPVLDIDKGVWINSGYYLALTALKSSLTLSQQEATIRKIAKDKDWGEKFGALTSDSDRLNTFLLFAEGLKSSDYQIPIVLSEDDNLWVYIYGYAMGYLTLFGFYNTNDGLDFIYSLGKSAENGKIISRDIPGLKVNQPSDSINLDRAQLNKGGIDLRAGKMPLEIRNSGEGIRFHLDPAQLAQLQNAPGFVPVIVGIEPLRDLRKFLGITAVAGV